MAGRSTEVVSGSGFSTCATAVILAVSLMLAGCSGDNENQIPGDNNSQNPDDGNPPAATDDSFDISVPDALIVTEGGDATSVEVTLFRSESHQRAVNLSLTGATSADEEDLVWGIEDSRLEVTLTGTESSTQISFSLGFSVGPRLQSTRDFVLTATDGRDTQLVPLTVTLQPVQAPDVYLLIGQSNMEGFSEIDVKQAQAGGADVPTERIQQLNVTANDASNFPDEAAFSDTTRQVAFPRLISAEDPLHESFDPLLNGKSGTYIGPGLSFAKAAITDTTQTIILVPAAWSGTGFCSNGLGYRAWNASDLSADKPWLGGTALYDRAVTRANIALAETGGILRGILWHQGEADSTNPDCAADYEANLTALISALRSNIIEDARGPAARGPDASVPFIAATMSRGDDDRGIFSVFDESKSRVDLVHRDLPNQVALSATVNNDDLVPPSYPCGAGSCIHFGAEAYREMGRRYYQQMQQLW